MAKITLWKAVQVAMQSAIGADLTITAITKANPGQVSIGSHGLANGDYVLLKDVLGMPEVNNKIFRVSGSTAGTFTLEGEDTTLYGTFTSGKANKLTFGTTFSTMLDFNVSGGEFTDVDTTTIHDPESSSIPGLPSALVATSSSIWDVSDSALKAAKAASDSQGQRAFLLTFQNGQKFLINGYIGCTLAPVGSKGEKVTTNLKLSTNGKSNTYAS